MDTLSIDSCMWLDSFFVTKWFCLDCPLEVLKGTIISGVPWSNPKQQPRPRINQKLNWHVSKINVHIHSLEPETTHFLDSQSFQLVHFSNSLLGLNYGFIIHPFLFTGSLRGSREVIKENGKKILISPQDLTLGPVKWGFYLFRYRNIAIVTCIGWPFKTFIGGGGEPPNDYSGTHDASMWLVHLYYLPLPKKNQPFM